MFGLLLLLLAADEGQAMRTSGLPNFLRRSLLRSSERKGGKRPVLGRQGSALDMKAPNHIVITYSDRVGKKYKRKTKECRNNLRVMIRGGGKGTCSLYDEESCQAGASEGACFSKMKKPCANQLELPDFKNAVISSSPRSNSGDLVQIWKEENRGYRPSIIHPDEEGKVGDWELAGKVVLVFRGRSDGTEHEIRCDDLEVFTTKGVRVEFNSPDVSYSVIDPDWT